MTIFKDETSLITGAASGLGRALTERLVEQGGFVVLVDINEDSIIKFANKLNECAGRSVALAVRADTTSWTEQLRAFELAKEQFKRIDYVFANAGTGDQVRLPLFDPSTAHERPFVENKMSALNVCLIGQLHTASLAIQVFERQERNAHGFRGKLVFTSSLFGIFPGPQLPIYAAAKTGLIAFARSLAPVYEVEGITVNAIAPGVMETNILPAEFYAAFKSKAKNLLTQVDFVVDQFDELLGADKTNGAIIGVNVDDAWRHPLDTYKMETSMPTLEIAGELFGKLSGRKTETA